MSAPEPKPAAASASIPETAPVQAAPEPALVQAITTSAPEPAKPANQEPKLEPKPEPKPEPEASAAQEPPSVPTEPEVVVP